VYLKYYFTLIYKADLLICYSILIILAIPFYFGIEVAKASNSSTETEGYWQLTEFGEAKYFQVYSFAFLVIERLIPTLLLIVLNITSLIKFKLMIFSMAQTSFSRSVDSNLVRLVLFLTFICILLVCLIS
jgi:hypothetical protein